MITSIDTGAGDLLYFFTIATDYYECPTEKYHFAQARQSADLPTRCCFLQGGWQLCVCITGVRSTILKLVETPTTKKPAAQHACERLRKCKHANIAIGPVVLERQDLKNE